MTSTRVAGSNESSAASIAANSVAPSALRRAGLSKESVAIPCSCTNEIVLDTVTSFLRLPKHRVWHSRSNRPNSGALGCPLWQSRIDSVAKNT